MLSVLNSKQPSSLDPLGLLGKHKDSRLSFGRGGVPPSHFGGPIDYKAQLEKAFGVPQGNKEPESTPPGFPPLQQAQEDRIGKLQGDSLTTQFDTEEETMTRSANVSTNLRSLGVKTSNDGKTCSIPKAKLEEVLAELKRLQENEKKWGQDMDKKAAQIADLEAQLKKKGGKASKSRKDEQKEDVVKALREYVKDVLFRNVKFAPPDDQLKAACGMVWAGLKGKMRLDQGPNKLDEEEFAAIYDSAVLKALSDRRQYVQTRCETAAKST